ncbi:hypothetical protein D3C77_499920 [compost metagenome]
MHDRSQVGNQALGLCCSVASGLCVEAYLARLQRLAQGHDAGYAFADVVEPGAEVTGIECAGLAAERHENGVSQMFLATDSCVHVDFLECE